MKKVFLYSILIAICLNLLFKLICYFQFEKAIGVVTHYESRSKVVKGRRSSYLESGISPNIEVCFNNKKYNICKLEWSFPYRISIHSKIEVLKYRGKEEFEINSFFYYWITIENLIYIFGFSVFFTPFFVYFTSRNHKKETE